MADELQTQETIATGSTSDLHPSQGEDRSYANFLYALGTRESSNNYEYLSGLQHAGYYQFTEYELNKFDYMLPDGTGETDWAGEWTGKDGINSLQDFLANHDLQDQLVTEAFAVRWANPGGWDIQLSDYVGRDFDGIELTESGLLAAQWLIGGPALQEMLDNGSVNADPNGTPATEYLQLFSGYDISPVKDAAWWL